MPRLTFEPVTSLWLTAGLAIALVVVLWLGPSFAKVTPQRRRTLVILRGSVIALALLALLRPAIVASVQQQQSAIVAVLLDFSRSMKLSHMSTGPSRWEAMREVFETNWEKIEAIRRENIDVQFYGFGSEPVVIEASSGGLTLPESPMLGETDLGSSIYDVLQSARDQRLLAMLVASDGVPNALDPDVEPSQAGKAVSDAQTPLFTIPFGQPAETGQFADVAIENMPDQYAVWIKNDLTVSAVLSARGFANQVIPVQLVIIDEQGNEEVVDTVRQTINKKDESVRIDLTYVPQSPGQYRLIVRAEPQEGEISSRNNELPAFLTVNEGGLRILFLYGSLGWEQRFVRQSLASYEDVELDSYYVDLRNRETQWPLNLARLFRNPQYDVFILCDVDSRALYQSDFQEDNLKALYDSVTQGKGLLMLGGYNSFGAGLYHLTPLRDLLPINMNFTERQDFQGPIRFDLHIQKPLTIRPTGQHFITRLGDPGENQSIWEQLPQLDGANQFTGGIKGAAKVLLESTAGDPILVSTIVGGRILAFAGDSTWKWWMHEKQDLHKKFWRQVVLWLAFRDGIEGENIWIDLPQRRFEPGSEVQFTSGASSQTDEEILDAQLSASLIGPDGTTTPLVVNTDSASNPSQIDRKLLRSPGIYSIDVVGRRNGEQIGSAKADFVVFDNDKEQSTPGADPELLNRLASQTETWGGRMVEPVEVGALLDEIVKLTPDIKVELPKKWQLGDTWFDALAYVMVFVGLITCEWWLRKKWGLV